MLAPDDRSVLLDLLRPPVGTILNVAVATTFTLDLEAALIAPLAFAPFDTTGPGDPIVALEAIRSVANRLTVFCQAGAIHVPQAASDLFSFLEPVIHEIRMPRSGHLFHPKLWLLRYIGEDNSEPIRLLVPTRNLTNDASWDAVLRLDGKLEGGNKAANRPLGDLVQWCLENTVHDVDEGRRAAIESLVASVRRTIWDHPEGVNEIQFHALGIPGRNRLDFSGRRHLVISPFITEEGINEIAQSERPIVVSRPEQLELIAPDVLSLLDCRCLTSLEVDHESPDSSPLGDLHAKVVVAEHSKHAHLFIGSANATGAAFGGNAEILVELVGGRAALGIDTILHDLGKVLEPFEVKDGGTISEEDELRKQLECVLRDAASVPLNIGVSDGVDGRWELEITSETAILPIGFAGNGKMEMLSRPGFALPVPVGKALYDKFKDIPLADISPFIVFRVELSGPTQTISGATVMRARLLNDPPGRLDAVIARQVDTPSKFLRFLFLLLGLAGSRVPPWLESALGGSGDKDFAGASNLIELGVFEALARSLVANPSALDNLGRLIDRLRTTSEGRNTLPTGFDELWDTVMIARQSLARQR